MPNYVQNEITMKGTNLNTLANMIQSESSPFDFNRIIPIPASYYINNDKSGKLYDSSTQNDRALVDYTLGRKQSEKDRTIGKQMFENESKYDAKDWYDFCCKYWGTKWDAIDATVTNKSSNSITIAFQTAWNAPNGIYKKLVDIIKENNLQISFYAEYADEDEGYNTGEFAFNGKKDSNLVWKKDKGGSDEAYKRYNNLW